MKRCLIILIMLIAGLICSVFNCSVEAMVWDWKYHTYNDVRDILNQFEAGYPQIAKVYDIGNSVNGKDILAIKISNNPGSEENETEVLFTGSHHGNEKISTEIPLLLAKYLCENYATDTRTKNIVDKGAIWIVPIVNPDGHGSGEFGSRTNANGVNLNRNYDFEWATEKQAGEDYPGPAPFSEPETQAVRDFVMEHNFLFVIDYHNFGKKVLYSWAYKDGSAYQPLLKRMAENLAKMITDTYYNQEIAYLPLPTGRSFKIAAGSFMDWCYGKESIPALTIELRPLNEIDGGYKLNPDQIEPTWKENKDAMLYVMEWAETGKDRSNIIDDFENNMLVGWSKTSGQGEYRVVYDRAKASNVLEMTTYSKNAINFGIKKELINGTNHKRFFSLSLNDTDDFLIQIKVKTLKENEYTLNYIPREIEHPYCDGNNIIYSIGTLYKDGLYHTITRDLEVDLIDVIDCGLKEVMSIQMRGDCRFDDLSFWDYKDYIAKVDSPFPKGWIQLNTQGWDFQCSQFTQFKGVGKPLRAYQTPLGPVYEYFATGKFLITRSGTANALSFPADDQFFLSYYLFGFLKLDKNGNLISTSARAEKGFDVTTDYIGYPVAFLEDIYSYTMYEALWSIVTHPSPSGGSGSLWGKGEKEEKYFLSEISTPVYKSIEAFGRDGEGLPIYYQGLAYYAFHSDQAGEEDPSTANTDFYLLEGTLYTIVKGVNLSPKTMLGTLRHLLITNEYEMRLESEALQFPVGEEKWATITVNPISGPSIEASMKPTIIEKGLPKSGVIVYPNPFKPNGSPGHNKITFSVINGNEINIKIFNLYGELVRDLNEGSTSGQILWDGTNDNGEKLASGVYLYLVSNNGQKYLGKISIIK